MKERGIIFQGGGVCAIQNDLKTHTRRTRGLKKINENPDEWECLGEDVGYDHKKYWVFKRSDGKILELRCPYGVAGDRLWIRETWRVGAWDQDDGDICVDYKADNKAVREWRRCPDEEMFERLWIQSSDDATKAGLEFDEEGQYHWEPGESPCRWRSSMLMPRWASRTDLEIVRVGVQRVQDITQEDIYAEGLNGPELFQKWAYLWDSINEKRGLGYDFNPWVFVNVFKKL